MLLFTIYIIIAIASCIFFWLEEYRVSPIPKGLDMAMILHSLVWPVVLPFLGWSLLKEWIETKRTKE